MSLKAHLCECEVDAVGERGDDEPPVEPHVLVAVGEGAGALPHRQLVRLALPVKPQLALPLKLLSLQNAARQSSREPEGWQYNLHIWYLLRSWRWCLPVSDEYIDDVSGVHIDDENSVVFFPVVFAQGHCNAGNEVIDLLVHFFSVKFHCLLFSLFHFSKDILYLPSPPHLISSKHHHALEEQHPINSTETHIAREAELLFILSN